MAAPVNLTEKLRQVMRSLLQEGGSQGTQSEYRALMGALKWLKPSWERVTGPDEPVPANLTASDRRDWYRVFATVLVAPKRGGLLLAGASPLLGPSPPGRTQLESASNEFYEAMQKVVSGLSFEENKAARQVAVYLRDRLLPVLRALGRFGRAVTAAEDYVASVPNLPAPSVSPAPLVSTPRPAPIGIPEERLIPVKPIPATPRVTVSPEVPEMVSIVTTAAPVPEAPGLVDQAGWRRLVSETLLPALVFYAEEDREDWNDFWLGRQRTGGVVNLRALQAADLAGRLPRDLRETFLSEDSIRALRELYEASMAALLLYWRYESQEYRDYLSPYLSLLEQGAADWDGFSVARLASDPGARVALEKLLGGALRNGLAPCLLKIRTEGSVEEVTSNNNAMILA